MDDELIERCKAVAAKAADDWTYSTPKQRAHQSMSAALARAIIPIVQADQRERDAGDDLAACERAIDRMGWPEINAFMSALGQSPYEDAGGFVLRKIKSLFGIKPDRLETYREAAARLVAEARVQEAIRNQEQTDAG